MGELLERIGNYWDKRADSYSEGLFTPESFDRWEAVLRAEFPSHVRKVLDVGTGPGFFAVLLARMGYDVTAVDYTPGMLKKAQDVKDPDCGCRPSRLNRLPWYARLPHCRQAR